jgi:hypothetical protein
VIRTNRWFVIATLALATTGCGLFRLGKGPPLERYRLEIPRPGADGGGSAQGFDPPSRRGNTYMWRGSIREFEEVNRGDTVLAAVAIDVQLLRTADDSIIWSGSQRLERVVPPPNTTMEPIVQVLSELAVEVVENLIDGARVALRTAPVDSARSPR